MSSGDCYSHVVRLPRLQRQVRPTRDRATCISDELLRSKRINGYDDNPAGDEFVPV